MTNIIPDSYFKFKGFRPEFGNVAHIRILEDMDELRKLADEFEKHPTPGKRQKVRDQKKKIVGMIEYERAQQAGM